MSDLKKNACKKALMTGPALLALLGVWFTWMGPGPAGAQLTGGPIAVEQGEGLRKAVTLPGALEEGRLPDQKFFNADALRAFYDDRGNSPAWTARFGRNHLKAAKILEVLDQSWTHGLNPNKYHVERIRELLGTPGESARAELELLVSDALVRYGRDLTGMRINPGDFAQKARYWRQPLEPGAILKKVSSSPDPMRTLAHFEPEGKFYAALRRELIALSQPVDGEETPITLRGKLRVGDANKQIPALRTRLGVPAGQGANANVYDDTLAKAVMDFQRRNAIKPDGVIGGETLVALNRTRADRVAQIVSNLERLRWVEQDKPERYILVNIPSATLWAVDDGKVELEMPVIVGKKARPTNSFKTEITGVRLNPNWTVPPTIKRADFLPELQADPGMLSRKGINLYRGGVNIDPASVDWNNISSRELANLRMTQAPGENNPLGKVRVIMENPYNIYLHDTNKPEYFDKDERALSSGCIRVSKPEQLARFILSANKEWTEEGMQKQLSSGRMRDVSTDTPLPVYILYQTVWQDSSGDVVFGPDVYGQDRRLIDQLGASEAFHRPESARQATLTF